jgi:hypothetical protein
VFKLLSLIKAYSTYRQPVGRKEDSKDHYSPRSCIRKVHRMEKCEHPNAIGMHRNISLVLQNIY